jgi:chemotaxis protein MotB
VTEALMAFKDRRFLIAGHTDNVPIKTRKFKNNWYLSTARAVSVLEFMIDAGFPSKGLAAAGYADKDPVGDNATPEGKELNRRIEIILVPDLSELPQLAEEPGSE